MNLCLTWKVFLGPWMTVRVDVDGTGKDAEVDLPEYSLDLNISVIRLQDRLYFFCGA